MKRLRTQPWWPTSTATLPARALPLLLLLAAPLGCGQGGSPSQPSPDAAGSTDGAASPDGAPSADATTGEGGAGAADSGRSDSSTDAGPGSGPGSDAATGSDATLDARAPDGAGGDATVTGDGGAEASAPPSVRWVGRVDLSTPSAPRFAWSGSGFVASVSGTTISVKLKSGLMSDPGANSPDPVYYQPIVDGDAGARFSVPMAGEQVVTIGTGLPPGPHLVELYRETEGKFSTSTFEGFVDGTPGPAPSAPGRLIEIVGDSISAGFGDLGVEHHPGGGPDPNENCVANSATQSAYATYGAILARTLTADVSIIAISGYGIYRDFQNDAGNVVPLYYADTLGQNLSPVWSFQTKPQAVLVNLGTNDFANGDPGQQPFTSAYTAFLGTIRSKYPDAWVFCLVGPMLDGDNRTAALTYVQDVVTAANQRGDARVSFVDLGVQDTTQTGCGYHPSLAEHQAMAATLAPIVKTALGW